MVYWKEDEETNDIYFLIRGEWVHECNTDWLYGDTV